MLDRRSVCLQKYMKLTVRSDIQLGTSLFQDFPILVISVNYYFYVGTHCTFKVLSRAFSLFALWPLFGLNCWGQRPMETFHVKSHSSNGYRPCHYFFFLQMYKSTTSLLFKFWCLDLQLWHSTIGLVFFFQISRQREEQKDAGEDNPRLIAQTDTRPKHLLSPVEEQRGIKCWG